MNICIGIISYLPDDQEIRKHRAEQLNKLLGQCDTMFKLPIMIIAQNWHDGDLTYRPRNNKIIIFNYKNKLGITGARRELRQQFLNSEYDYLIMLDDDSTLVGTQAGADKYIKQIEAHPGQYGIFKAQLLKLFAISKEMFMLLDYPELEAENGEIFEDMYLIKGLTKLYPEKKFNFTRSTELDEYSNSANDKYSTWFHHQFEKHTIGDHTRYLLNKLTG